MATDSEACSGPATLAASMASPGTGIGVGVTPMLGGPRRGQRAGSSSAHPPERERVACSSDGERAGGDGAETSRIGRAATITEPIEHKAGVRAAVRWLKNRLSDKFTREDRTEWEVMGF